VFWKLSLVEFKTMHNIQKCSNPECFREKWNVYFMSSMFFSLSCTVVTVKCEEICGNFFS
jgi:hypothetical protein